MPYRADKINLELMQIIVYGDDKVTYPAICSENSEYLPYLFSNYTGKFLLSR